LLEDSEAPHGFRAQDIREPMVPNLARFNLLVTFFALLAALAAIAAFSATPTITGPSKGDPQMGKKVFKEKCIACHKVDGSGGVKVTGNPTPDWRNAKRMADPKYNDDYLRDCITNGKLKSGMFAWSKQGVKPATIENLIAYIRTFSGTKSDSIRTLSAAKGDSTRTLSAARSDSIRTFDAAKSDSAKEKKKK
jgi:mono/diheme cytochrome c family protein